jgi:hypothetical protein
MTADSDLTLTDRIDEVCAMQICKAVVVALVVACMALGGVPVAPVQAAPVNMAFAATAFASPAAAAYAPGWPRVVDRDGNHVIVYQPQLKSWTQYRTLVADTAISITPAGGQQILGVISWRANTLANVSARTVFVNQIEVLSARFPSLDPTQDAVMQAKVHQIYPTMTFNISLDRMIASLAHVNTPVQSIPANTDVPTIFATTTPAISLMVNGKPVLAPIDGVSLEYVVNTNWNLFYDKTNYYLLDGKTWLKAKDIPGPWSVATSLPPDMAKLPKGQNWDDVLKAVPPAAGAGPAPKVFVTEKPAELIIFRGAPIWIPIPGTTLSYGSNTENQIFLSSKTKQLYVLLSGRWFRAGSLEAPWVYAGNDLPPDFAMIPAGKTYSTALVSVPGTQVASDAVLLSQVPTTAVVNRAAAESSVKIVYAGEPQFVAISGTTMYYAVNTSARVIRVGNIYYLCYNGIWFFGPAAMGPWKTADTVPQVIYTIPPSCPMYNVTYVIVSNPTPTTIETSYSSGYLGVFVLGMAVGATVVYGTGWYYPPYIYYGPRYPIYYPYPYTYGVAAVYNPYTGFYGVGRAVYGPYASAGSAAWYNPTTGFYGHAVTYQNAYGGHTYASAYNPWTGTYAATSQGHNAYAQWGSSVVTNGDNWAQAGHYSNANGTVAGFDTSKGSAGAGVTTKNGNNAFVAKDANNNNVYAGADGNVYKKDSNGDWSKWDDGGWQPVDPSTGNAQTKKSQEQSKTQNNLSGATNPNGSSSGNLGATKNGAGNGSASGSGTQNGTGNGGTNGSGTGNGNGRRAQNGANGGAGAGSGAGSGTGTGGLGQSRQTPQPPGGANSDLGSQLNNDAGSRSRGDQLEQQNRGGGAGGGNRGGGGGSRRSGGGGRPPR